MTYPGDIGDKYQIGTVQAGKMPSAETDATFFIDLATLVKAGTDIFDTLVTDGGAIRVTTSDGSTEIARCILSIDLTAKTGIIAINAPSLNVASTVRVYYNGTATEPAADSPYGSENAWDSTYDGAYFAANKDVATITDATANGNDGTIVGTEIYTYYYDSKQTDGPGYHQGCRWDGTTYYFFDTNAILKSVNFDGSSGTSNTDILGDVNTDKSTSCNHSGCGSNVYDGYVYVGMTTGTYPALTNCYIARFNATTLVYDEAWKVGDHSMAGLHIEPTHGDNGTIYICDFNLSTIHRYDLVTPTIDLGDITITGATVNDMQGIDYDGDTDEFIIGAPADIFWLSFDGVDDATYIGNRMTLSDGGLGFAQNAFKYGDDVYSWQGVADDLYKYVPITEKITSSLGPVLYTGQGTVGDDPYISFTHTIPEAFSLQTLQQPRVTYFNYSTMWTNSAGAGEYDAWLDVAGDINWRINNSVLDYDLDNLHSPNGYTYDYLIYLNATKNGSTAERSIVIDGVVRDSSSTTWITPGTSTYSSGGPSTGNRGKSYIFFMAFRNIDIGKDADKALSEYNNQSAPDTFWAFGDEQTDAGGSTLTIDNLSQSQSLLSIDLVQANVLSIDALNQAQNIDNITFSLAVLLQIADIAQSQNIDVVNLIQQNILAIDGIDQSQSLDNIDMIQANLLSIEPIDQGQTLDNIVLGTGVLLQIAGIAQSQIIDNIDLIQQNILSIFDIDQSQAIDNIDLTQANILAIAGLTQQQIIDNVVLSITRIEGKISISFILTSPGSSETLTSPGSTITGE